jgi:phage shock protein E
MNKILYLESFPGFICFRHVINFTVTKSLIMKNILIIGIVGLLGLFFFKEDQLVPSKKQDFKAMIKSNPGVVIDVRTKSEWDAGHIQRAINSDWTNGDFAKLAETLDKSKTYYLHCAAGGRSGQATNFLKEKGFKNVYNIGGYEEAKKCVE